MTQRFNSPFRLFLIIVLPILFVAPQAAWAQAVKVRIGSSLSPPSLDAILPYVALEQGFLRKHGLDGQVIAFRGGGTNMKALLAGEVDVSQIGATDAIQAAAKGARVRLWFVPVPVSPFYFVARKEAATTLQALVGKSVAVSGIGALSHHIPRIVLQRSGVDPDKVQYVALGSPADRFRALLAGKVDATLVLSTEAAKLAQYPEIITLAQVSKVLPEVPYEFAIAKEEYLERNPETFYRLALTLLEANRWIAANKAGTVAIAGKAAREETPEVLARAYDLADPRQWGVNGDIGEASYKYTADFLAKVGYLKEAPSLDRFFDRRFLDRALKELGRM